MDDIVKQALAKWPNVPYCYGWLGLDARGNWRMRDERAQHLNLPGDKLNHAALVAFIVRNYAADERGCWYFQNGPQRVYLNLEATPFIARTDPVEALVLHTGATLAAINAAWLTEQGELILTASNVVAQVDDRDVAQLLATVELDGEAVGDEQLLAWLARPHGALTLAYRGSRVAIGSLHSTELAQRLGFVRRPVPEGF